MGRIVLEGYSFKNLVLFSKFEQSKQVKKHMHRAIIGHQEKKLGFGLEVLIFENVKRQGEDFFLR